MTHLNLGWNTLFEEEKHQDEIKHDDTNKEQQEEIVWYLQTKLSAFNQSVMNLLAEIIKKNKSLLHLNLDAVGLTEAMVCMIGKNLRRAKSLLSIHMSYNPGTLPKAIETVRETIHAKEKMAKQNRDIRLKLLMSNF